MANDHIADDRKKVRLIDANEAYKYARGQYRDGRFTDEEYDAVLQTLDDADTVDAVPAEKYNELEVRYKKMIETADILDTALRQYQRTYGE